MKTLILIFLFASFVNAMQTQNKFSEKIDKSKETEKETLSLQKSINSELVNNISIKTNLLKKTDENYTRLGVEKSLTGIYIQNFLKEGK